MYGQLYQVRTMYRKCYIGRPGGLGERSLTPVGREARTRSFFLSHHT